MPKPKAKPRTFPIFPKVIYRADLGSEGQLTYDSLEDMRDSIPDGSMVAIYTRSEIKRVRFGQVTLEN